MSAEQHRLIIVSIVLGIIIMLIFLALYIFSPEFQIWVFMMF